MKGRINVWPQPAAWLSGLAPEARRKVRSALHAMEQGKADAQIKALEGPLDGYYRLRAGYYRIIFRPGARGS